jgi:HAD superfamily hydrolase (TIGR01509 family)
MGGVTPSELDAVTIDGYGTLVELDRPLERLRDALAARGLERSEEAVRAAFSAEVAYYRDHKTEGREDDSLADLRRRCAHVFAEAAGAGELELTDDFVRSLVFVPLPGVRPALARLRAHGLALAVVSNWDVGLHEHLDALGLAPFFATVVTSAEVGVEKPDPAVFRLALERLGVAPSRALHVGDDGADEEGAKAVGMHFVAAPLAAVPV